MGLMGGGFFGSGAKKNSGNTTNDTKNSVANLDFAEANGNFSTLTLGTTTDSTIDITQTDYGAVMGGLDLASKALDSITGLANSSAENNAALAEQASRTGDEKNIDSSVKLIGLALLGGSLFLYILKKGKG